MDRIDYGKLKEGWYWAIENKLSSMIEDRKEMLPHYVASKEIFPSTYDLALDYIERIPTVEEINDLKNQIRDAEVRLFFYMDPKNYEQKISGYNLISDIEDDKGLIASNYFRKYRNLNENND